MRCVAVMLLGLLLGACLIDIGYDGTRFRCDQEPTCPADYVCVAGECVPDDDGPSDAGRPDAAAPDGTPIADAARPDAVPVTMLSFGETVDDDVTGVTADAELREDAATHNYGGRHALGMDEMPYHTSLLRFDLSAIPTGATVVDATLIVWTTTDLQEQGSIQAFRVLEAWDEGAENDAPGVANYALRQPTTPWTTLGVGPGSRDTVVLADFAPNLAETRWQVPFATAAVQAWVDAPDSNFGMALVSTDAAGHGCQLRSSESSRVAERPRLVVSFTAPPG